jgi:hypothetical protein
MLALCAGNLIVRKAESWLAEHYREPNAVAAVGKTLRHPRA